MDTRQWGSPFRPEGSPTEPACVKFSTIAPLPSIPFQHSVDNSSRDAWCHFKNPPETIHSRGRSALAQYATGRCVVNTVLLEMLHARWPSEPESCMPPQRSSRTPVPSAPSSSECEDAITPLGCQTALPAPGTPSLISQVRDVVLVGTMTDMCQRAPPKAPGPQPPPRGTSDQPTYASSAISSGDR